MSESKFSHYPLKLVEPVFSSQLTDLVLELDYLRKKQLGGSTSSKSLFSIKKYISYEKMFLKATQHAITFLPIANN